MNLVFNGTPVQIISDRYLKNGRIYLELQTVAEGEPYAEITVNVPHERLNPDEIIVKDYELTGLLQWLIDNKIVSDPIRHINLDFNTAPVVKLLYEG